MPRQTNFNGNHGYLSWEGLFEGLRDGRPFAYFAAATMIALGCVAIWAGRNLMKRS